MDQQPTSNNAILVLGNTGSGKSTLINYLCGKTLQAKETSNDFFGKYSLECNQQLTKISSGGKSETFTPIPIRDNQNHLIFWDCPGYNDTRGELVGLINAYCIAKIAKKTNKAKVLLVVDSAEAKSSRGEHLREILKTVSSMFSYKENLSNIILCINKVDTDITHNSVLDYIKHTVYQHTPDKQTKLMLKSIIDNDQLVIMHKAKKGDVLNISTDKNLLKVLNRTVYENAHIIKPVILNKHFPFVYSLLNHIDDDVKTKLLSITQLVADKFKDCNTEFLKEYATMVVTYKQFAINNQSQTIEIIRKFKDLIVLPVSGGISGQIKQELEDIDFLIEEIFLGLLNKFLNRNRLEANTFVKPLFRITRHLYLELFDRNALDEKSIGLLTPKIKTSK